MTDSFRSLTKLYHGLQDDLLIKMGENPDFQLDGLLDNQMPRIGTNPMYPHMNTNPLYLWPHIENRDWLNHLLSNETTYEQRWHMDPIIGEGSSSRLRDGYTPSQLASIKRNIFEYRIWGGDNEPAKKRQKMIAEATKEPIKAEEEEAKAGADLQ